ncbi:MAG: ATP-binding protein [Bacteroidota bacterium]
MKTHFLLFLIALMAEAQSQTVPLHEEQYLEKAPLLLNPYTLLFTTHDYVLHPDSIADDKWSKHPEGPVFGIADKYYWLKYQFNNLNSDSLHEVFFIPYHHIYKLTIWQKQHQTKKMITTGTAYSVGIKNYRSRGYPVDIVFPPGKSDVFVRLNHLYMPLRSSAYLLTPDQIDKNIINSESTIWFWRGIFMFALVVSLVLFLSTRIQLFLHYFLLNLGVAFFIGMEIGDFFMFFTADPHKFIIDIKHLGNIMVVLFFPYFLNELTPIRKYHQKLWRIMVYGIYLMLSLWFLCLFPAFKNSYLLYITVAYFIGYTSFVFVLQIFFLAAATYRRQRNAIILLITYFFYIAAVTLNVILPNLGFSSDSILVYNTLMFGSIFEIFTFMILMGKETLTIYRERAGLLEKQKRHQSEVIKAMVDSQEIERNKLGRELHDMIGANISVIRQQVDKTNKSLVSVIDYTIEAVRNLSHGLVTPMIKRNEFKDEINELCLMFSNDNFEVRSSFFNWRGIKNPEIATHLYRIVQELLQNAIKHSEAKQVRIQFLIDYENIITLAYEDNGKGFNYQNKSKTGIGLINIENRVKLINGKLNFDTKPGGKGTNVIIELQNRK